MPEANTVSHLPLLSLRRLAAVFGWGVVATLAMTALMATIVVGGVSPLPKPIPAALVSQSVGWLPQQALLPLALMAHLAYGGFAAAVLAGLTRRINVKTGLLWGGALWVLTGAAWMPYLGWGPFGLQHTPASAVAALVPHLVYGAVLGWSSDRHRAAETA